MTNSTVIGCRVTVKEKMLISSVCRQMDITESALMRRLVEAAGRVSRSCSSCRCRKVQNWSPPRCHVLGANATCGPITDTREGEGRTASL